MKALIAITDETTVNFFFNQAVLNRLQGMCEVEFLNQANNLKDRVRGKDIILTSWGSPKLTKEVLEEADSLKFYGHAAGTVVPYIDSGIFTKGIKIVNGNVALARSTAECTLMLMLAGTWKIKENMNKTRLGIWSDLKGDKPSGLYRKTVGIVGLGEISREVIRLIAPFECRILLYSPHCTAGEANDLQVELCSLEELLVQSDIISLHNTLTEKTRGMISDAELSQIKDGALFVNTARGPIVQQEALKKHVINGRIYAALDVYEEEPLPPDSEWTKFDNVIATPHCGGYSEYWMGKISTVIVDEIERFLHGRPLQYEITEERFTRLTLK
ncbi:MAG: hydroxyacid dehydrogenase [Paenibacillaceae bacterium]|jgi:phosphoglycerate dehydrogenase-like enzyme|nr:hydroxyacid dehydrogenase [Paenibacillaceae bacterium]